MCLETKCSLKLDSLPANGHLHPVIVKTSCEVTGSYPDACFWKQMRHAAYMSATPLSIRGSMCGAEQGLDKVRQPLGSKDACNDGQDEREERKKH